MKLDRIRDFLFAPRALCAGCESVLGAGRKTPFCPDCEKLLEPLYLTEAYRTFRCRKCGEILDGKVCTRCRERLPGGVYAYSAYAYAMPVSALIRNFKFKGAYTLSEWMAQELAASVRKSGEEFDLIVPVPIHFLRKLIRGFNQSEKLAKSLSEILNIPFENSLKKTRYTRKQSKASPEKRIHAPENAFRADAAVLGKRILLVDDVITTGATLIHSAHALFRAGCTSVSLCAFAISASDVKKDKKS